MRRSVQGALHRLAREGPERSGLVAICGEIAAPTEFKTPEQFRQIRETGIAHVKGQLDEAIQGAHKPVIDAGLMAWTYQAGERPLVVPADAAPVMTQRSTCEACGCAYASIGAAFFCPACGHNSARTTFAGALTTVRGMMGLADRMAAVVDDRDAAADAARHLAENSLVRVWASFQRFAEASYLARPGTTPPRRNAFQSLAESDRLWQPVIGKTYTDILTEPEYGDLVRLIQGRHVLAHQDGIVDGDYVAHSGDPRYAVGQRLVVTSGDARRLADLTEKLSAAL